MADWGAGSYELMAVQIESVATEVIDAVEPVEDLKLLDLACGTGNATLVAARRGAHAVGYDGASRLLEVAESRATEEGLSIGWMEGDIHELPFAGESYDIVTSVFGIIFASDPGKVAAEIGRVLNHQGRFAISTWKGEGALASMADIWRSAVAAKVGEDNMPAMSDWDDENFVTELFAEHGLAAHCENRMIAFTGESPDEMIDSWKVNHPLWLGVKPLLGEDGFDQAVEESREMVRAANLDPSAFWIEAEYLIISGSPV